MSPYRPAPCEIPPVPAKRVRAAGVWALPVLAFLWLIVLDTWPAWGAAESPFAHAGILLAMMCWIGVGVRLSYDAGSTNGRVNQHEAWLRAVEPLPPRVQHCYRATVEAANGQERELVHDHDGVDVRGRPVDWREVPEPAKVRILPPPRSIRE